MYNPGEIQGFCPKSCNLRPSSNHFVNLNAITWLLSNHLLHQFQITIHLASFIWQKNFWQKKISLAKCQLNRLLNLNWGKLGPQLEHLLLNPVIFMTKQKSPKQIILEWLLTAKNIAGGNVYFVSSTWAKALTKFTPKIKLLKVFWTWSVSKGKTHQFDFFQLAFKS